MPLVNPGRMARGSEMDLELVDIFIIGGGIAGLATAAHLALAGARSVLLAEREAQPGFHASGHNAGIARRLTGRPEHTALAVQGADLLAEAGLLKATGGYLLGAAPGATKALATEARGFGLVAHAGPGSPEPGWNAAEHLHLPGDGVIDTDAEMRHCAQLARAGGARLRFGCQVLDIRPQPSGFRLETDAGPVAAGILVNAAGAWAQQVGRLAGGLDLAFRPLRRHLVWSHAAYPAGLPWAWWADRPFYLRPESGGALLCPCDEELVAVPDRGRQPATDGRVLESLAGSVRELAPALGEAPLTRHWCGLRTFAPDRRFVLGPDPRNPRLHWVAGLGGHGMTSGLAVGRLAAQMILSSGASGVLDPARFSQTALQWSGQE